MFRRNMEQVLHISSIKPSFDSVSDTGLSSFQSRRASQAADTYRQESEDIIKEEMEKLKEQNAALEKNN